MKLQLRFGMHRDIELIHEMSEKIDGLVIPAHILAHQAASTSVFVASLYDKDYIIDPMSFILQNPKKNHYKKNNEIRPSVRKLLDRYHEDLVHRLAECDENDYISASVLDSIASDFCRNSFDFQMNTVATDSGKSSASKYLQRYGNTQATSPRLIVPPYFFFQSTNDPFYNLSLNCAKITLGFGSSIPICPVILCSPSILDNSTITKIVEDYSGFEHVYLWMNQFIQSSARIQDIVNVRKLISSLNSMEINVESLYGGYLMGTMEADGLKSVSHGILYTQDKSYLLPPGSGGAPERYYIPGVWDFRSMSQTDIILHQYPDLMCDCITCEPIFDGDPDNIAQFLDNPGDLRRHFLTVRRQEFDEIGSIDRADVAQRFRDAHFRYHESFSNLRNPDAITKGATMQGIDYLLNWAKAITTQI